MSTSAESSTSSPASTSLTPTSSQTSSSSCPLKNKCPFTPPPSSSSGPVTSATSSSCPLFTEKEERRVRKCLFGRVLMPVLSSPPLLFPSLKPAELLSSSCSPSSTGDLRSRLLCFSPPFPHSPPCHDHLLITPEKSHGKEEEQRHPPSETSRSFFSLFSSATRREEGRKAGTETEVQDGVGALPSSCPLRSSDTSPPSSSASSSASSFMGRELPPQSSSSLPQGEQRSFSPFSFFSRGGPPPARRGDREGGPLPGSRPGLPPVGRGGGGEQGEGGGGEEQAHDSLGVINPRNMMPDISNDPKEQVAGEGHTEGGEASSLSTKRRKSSIPKAGEEGTSKSLLLPSSLLSRA